MFGKRNESNTQAFSRMELEKHGKELYHIFHLVGSSFVKCWNVQLIFWGPKLFKGTFIHAWPSIESHKIINFDWGPQEHLEECQLGEKHGALALDSARG